MDHVCFQALVQNVGIFNTSNCIMLCVSVQFLYSTPIPPPPPRTDCKIIKTSDILESDYGKTVKVEKGFCRVGTELVGKSKEAALV